MGDRNTTLSVVEQIVSAYRTTLRDDITSILSEKWRLVDDGKTAFVNGDGLLGEDMLGAVSSLLSGSPSFRGRMLFVRTLTNDGTYRFSSRKSRGCNSLANLGLIMRHCSEAFNGAGGGHSAAAGCRIPSSALEDFIASIKAAINDPKFAKDYSP
jgi:single-stranded-DNA-specific exonuclease